MPPKKFDRVVVEKSTHDKINTLSDQSGMNKCDIITEAVDIYADLQKDGKVEISLTDYDRYTMVLLGDALNILEMTRKKFINNVPKEMYAEYRNWQGRYRIPPEQLWNIVQYLDDIGKLKQASKARITRRIQRLFAIKALWEGMIKGDVM